MVLLDISVGVVLVYAGTVVSTSVASNEGYRRLYRVAGTGRHFLWLPVVGVVVASAVGFAAQGEFSALYLVSGALALGFLAVDLIVQPRVDGEASR